jgi:hypothetical protein
MIKFQGGGLSQANAYYMATMSPEQRAAMAEQSRRGQMRQSGMRLGAGAFDFFKGRAAQKDAEGRIEELGAQAEDIKAQLGGMRAPSSMDPNTVAEATRNAAILGFQDPVSDTSDDLASQAMALGAGADPSKLYAAASAQDQAADARERAEAMAQFNQGLGLAQQDALRDYQQDYNQLAGELGDVNQQLNQAQQESLIAQQQKNRGIQGAITGGIGIAQSQVRPGEDRGFKNWWGQNFGNQDRTDQAWTDQQNMFDQQAQIRQQQLLNQYNQGDGTGVTTGNAPADSYVGGVEGIPLAYNIDFNLNDPNYDPTGGLDPGVDPLTGEEVEDWVRIANMKNNAMLRAVNRDYAQGGSVQQTPGEYDHDTNDMILMAQGRDGMLVDTGIRQTGGEYVIDPFDAGNMRQAHDKIDPMELEAVRTGRAELSEELLAALMQLYDALRFVDEPQFQDDYYEKKMNGYA